MTSSPEHSIMSVEEYLELDRHSTEARYEYNAGHVKMLAGGTPDHAKISANLIGVLYGLLEGNPCSVYTSDVRVCLSESRYVYPDVSVSCDAQDQDQEDMIYHPSLVVEVLSPATEAHDRGRKLAYYRECPTIQEYVLVNTQRPYLEMFRREVNELWTYRVFEIDDEVELASLSVRFPLAKIYRNVVFSEDSPSS